MKTKISSKNLPAELLTLANIGPAMCQDLVDLGIHTIHELAKADPDELYLRLQRVTGTKQDPCVWDVFAAAIYEACTGEKHPWWHWTPIRQERQTARTFCRNDL